MKPLSTALRRLLLAVVAIAAITAGTAWATAPNPPDTLAGQYYSGPQLISLNWRPSPTGSRPTSYNIYQASGAQIQPNGFTQIGSRSDSTGANWQIFSITGLAPGTYSFYITSVNADGESAPGSIVVITIPGGAATVSFSSVPVVSAQAGVGYSYDANASASDGASITYSLLPGAPDGMTIDAATGLIAWTPSESGVSVQVGVRAGVTGSQIHADQNFTIVVASCAAPAHIGGIVVDQDGVGINGARVTAFSRRDMATPVASAIVADGAYRLDVQAGSYYLRVTEENPPHGKARIATVWYPYVTDSVKSQTVTTQCGATTTADFQINATRWYLVAGSVLRASDDSPVPDATVVYTCTIRGTTTKTDYTTHTGQDGSYSMILADVGNYTAMASPAYGDSTLLPIYYDGITSPISATVFRLRTDRSDITFHLPDRPDYDNRISGTIYDAARKVADAQVMLVPVSGSAVSPALVTKTDGNGGYSFNRVLPGDYWILAIPNVYGTSAPSYYSAGGSVLTSSEATAVTLADSILIGPYDIFLHSRNAAHGVGSAEIHGTVSRPAGRARKGDGNAILSEEKLETVSGALVALNDLESNLLEYTYTSESGSFTIRGIQPGTYELLVDRPGSQKPFRQQVVVSAGTIDLAIVIDQLPAGGEFTSATVPGRDNLAYPNPVHDHVAVEFSGHEGEGSYGVIDALGREVASGKLGVVDGTNRLEIDTRMFSAGFHTIRITASGRHIDLPIIVVR